MMTSNDIGNQGENTAAVRLGKYGVFRVFFLGEKAPIEDFLIEINNDEQHPYQALIQVKSTDKPKKSDRYNVTGDKINTPVPNEKLKKLHGRPLPSYVAGVDVEDEVVFIAPAFMNNGSYSTIPNKLVLDIRNVTRYKADLEKLKNDIINYWETGNVPAHKQAYNSQIS